MQSDIVAVAKITLCRVLFPLVKSDEQAAVLVLVYRTSKGLLTAEYAEYAEMKEKARQTA